MVLATALGACELPPETPILRPRVGQGCETLKPGLPLRWTQEMAALKARVNACADIDESEWGPRQATQLGYADFVYNPVSNEVCAQWNPHPTMDLCVQR